MCFIKFAYNPIYICLKTGLCIEYGWVIRVFFYILIIYQGKIIKKNFKSKIYGKLTTIKVIILSFRLYLCSYSMYFFVWYCLFDEFCYINTDIRLLKLIIIDKFTLKIHLELEKYIKRTVFLLNMKYLCNICMLDNDFSAGDMLIRNNLLLVYLRKCLIFYDYVWFD